MIPTYVSLQPQLDAPAANQWGSLNVEHCIGTPFVTVTCIQESLLIGPLNPQNYIQGGILHASMGCCSVWSQRNHLYWIIDTLVKNKSPEFNCSYLGQKKITLIRLFIPWSKSYHLR